MDVKIARNLVARELEALRMRSFESLRDELLGNPRAKQMVGPDGKQYQIEVQALWDDEPGSDLRVMVSIDDGGWRTFAPLSDSFIISPGGGFVGE